MSSVPSIKGSVLSGHLDELLRLVSCGEISQSLLESRFPPEDLVLFDQELLIGAWYDILIYTRVMELLRDVAGEGKNEYLQDRGAASAEALLYSGMYQQFEYLKRTQMQAQSNARDRHLAFGRDLRLLVTLNDHILNFSRASVEQDPDHDDRWILETSEAAAYPEVLCWATQGFNNRMAQEHGSPGLWHWERPQEDIIQFRMRYSV
jgi:hypothetical protein